jgi:flagellar basal-body rod modification protein FlgD
MAIDTVQTSSTVDAYGNSYTTTVSNDQLTNDDFLQIMLQEFKMQDPTEPMDSDKILDNQMKMSSIDSNAQLAKSMEVLKASYANSALANSANLIGHIIQNGEINEKGEDKLYKIDTIENKNGELYANVKPYSIVNGEEILGDLETIPLSNITKIN